MLVVLKRIRNQAVERKKQGKVNDKAGNRGEGFFLIKKPKKHNTYNKCNALFIHDFMGLLVGGIREAKKYIQEQLGKFKYVLSI